MILPTIATDNTLVADEYLSAAVDDFGCNKTGEISDIYSILNTSIVAYQENDALTELEFSNECEAFKQDAIRSEVSSVSCAYYPVLFVIFWMITLPCQSFLQLLQARQLVQKILTL